MARTGGLFFADLMGRAGGDDIRVYERDAEGATYGWGLVFSDVALSFVREIAPEVYDSITRGQVVFDDMEIKNTECREPGTQAWSPSDLVRLRLPAPQRPGESCGNPEAGPGPGGGVRTAASRV